MLTLAIVPGCLNKDDAPTTPTGNSSTDTGMANMSAEAISLSLVDGVGGIQPGVPPKTMGISPNALTLEVGMRYNLTVTNDGMSGHNLIIEGLDVATDTIAPGDSVSVEFLAGEAGDYPMYCSLGAAPLDHRTQGMDGTVTVA